MTELYAVLVSLGVLWVCVVGGLAVACELMKRVQRS